MDEILDTFYLQKRLEKTEKIPKNINEEVYINNQLLIFERENILDKFSLLIPTTIGEMPEMLRNIKYPELSATTTLLTNEDLTVNFSFEIYEDVITNEELFEKTNEFRNALLQIKKTSKFENIESLDEQNGCYFSFRQQVIDADIMHIVGYILREDYYIKCTFNCLLAKYLMWEEIVILMWETINKKKEEQGDEYE